MYANLNQSFDPWINSTSTQVWALIMFSNYIQINVSNIYASHMNEIIKLIHHHNIIYVIMYFGNWIYKLNPSTTTTLAELQLLIYIGIYYTYIILYYIVHGKLLVIYYNSNFNQITVSVHNTHTIYW